MLRVVFICLLLLIQGANSNRRLRVIESRLKTIEERMNFEIQDLKVSVETALQDLNETISDIIMGRRLDRLDIEIPEIDNAKAKIDGNSPGSDQQTKSTGGIDGNSPGSNQRTKSNGGNVELSQRVMKAFADQKEWLHKTMADSEIKRKQLEMKQLESEKQKKQFTTRVDALERKDTKRDEQLESLQMLVESLKVNVTSLEKKNENLTEELMLKEMEIEGIESDIDEVKEQREEDKMSINVLNTNVTSLTQIMENMTEELKDKTLVLAKTIEQSKKEINCLKGWQKFDKHCYFFEDRKMSYSDAKLFCTQKDAKVVDVQNEEENVFVSDLAGHEQYNWIGMSDEETEGRWVWDKNGEVATYTNWNSGQPNNVANKQHCAIMGEGSPYGWGDVPCDFRYNVVCKI